MHVNVKYMHFYKTVDVLVLGFGYNYKIQSSFCIREHKNYLKEAVFMILLAIKDRRAGGWRLAMQKMSSPLVVKRLYSRPVRLDKGKMNPPGRPLCYNKPSPLRLPLVPFSLTEGLSWNPQIKNSTKEI